MKWREELNRALPAQCCSLVASEADLDRLFWWCFYSGNKLLDLILVDEERDSEGGVSGEQEGIE